MKLTHLFAALPLAFAPLAFAETAQLQTNHSVFHFSAQVEKVVEKDLMFAEVSSRKAGQRLSELKNSVSANLNKVVEAAKKETEIQIATNGVSHYPEYNSKGKVTGWVAEGRVMLEGKNFEAIANVLENLGDDIAINYIQFTVSPEKQAQFEDELTREAVQQLQHKSDIIQQQLKAKRYVLSDIKLTTPNGHYDEPMMARSYMLESAKSAKIDMPLEADKARLQAVASGQVTFIQE